MASSLTGVSIASSYDSLLKVGDNDGLSATLQVISDGLGTETGISLNNAGDLTATGTITANSFVGSLSGNISGNTTVSGTLTFGSLSDGTLTMTDILDEDNMVSDSATALATQQSIKAYVDAQVTASDLDYQGDSGGQQSIDLDSQVFTIAGTANEITTTGSPQTLTIGLADSISGLTSVSATSFTGALTGNVTGQVSDVSNHDTDDISEGTTNLYYTDARFDTRLATKSTTDLSEGTNLYYTDARADARVNLQTGSNLDLSSKSTTDLSEGTNLYYTSARFDSAFTAKSTTDLSEGTNLYFTDERVDDRVANLVVAGTSISATYNDVANSLTIANTAPDQTVVLTGGTGISTSGTYPNFTITNDNPDQTVAVTGSNGLTSGGTYPNLTIAGDDATTSTKGVASFSSDHFSVTSGAVSLAADSIDDTLIDFGTGAGQVNTDDLPEGSSNLYYTAERVDDQVNTLLTAGSGITLSYDDPNGTLTIAATSSGIGLTSFSATSSGIGSLAYNNTTGVFTYTGPSKLEIDGLGIAASTAATLATARTINGTSFDGSANISFDTDSVTEGASNLYYTDARVQAISINALSEDSSPQLSANLDGQSYDITTTGKIYYGNMFATTGDLPSATTYHGMFAHVHGTGKGYFAHNGNWVVLLDETSSDTDDLTEGATNLYYTDARFDTRLSAKTTDNLTEGSTNLYNQTHTGDVTGATALTIASDAVTYDKMQDLVTANRVLGGTAAGTIAEVQIVNAMMAADSVDSDQYVDGSIDTAHIADDNITFAKLENRYTALSALGSSTSFALDFSAATTFTATASGNATFTFSNAVQGQVIDLILTGNFTITFSETGSTFNLVGTTAYDGTTNNLIQIVCTDDSSGSKVYHYSVAAYASDPTP
jgi:hypothetical protein